MPYTYDYPRPMVTVDILLLQIRNKQICLLLIQRKNPPFPGKWALPGGYVDMGESPDAAACRELKEETGLDNIPLQQLAAFGDPGRDPRGHTITIVYGGAIPPGATFRPRAGDDAGKAQWFSINALPDLAFDHQKIISYCLEKIHRSMLIKFW